MSPLLFNISKKKQYFEANEIFGADIDTLHFISHDGWHDCPYKF